VDVRSHYAEPDAVAKGMTGHSERLAYGFRSIVNAWQHMAVQVYH